MTVQRNSDDYFNTPFTVLARAVRTVLRRCPPYFDTVEKEIDTLFKTNVKPGWWLAGTEMSIELKPSSGGTEVSVKTQSQVLVRGDIFGFYKRFIRSFLKDLRAEIQD